MKHQPSSAPFKVTRRQFVAGAAAATGAAVLGFPNIVHAVDKQKLRLVFIAAGGRATANLGAMRGEEVVALCDADSQRLHTSQQKFGPKAKPFTDYRKLYDSLKDSEFDGVVVSTPEHHHAFATLPALLRKKPVYCEKPLTRDVYEARVVREIAKQAGVPTQMGTQNHANNNFRRVVELIRANVIGPVAEAHTWVNRAWGWQTREQAEKNKDRQFEMDHGNWVMDRPKESMPVPDFLDWDLWVGPAPMRPFHTCYWPGPKWYRWWDFGNGTMSDLGSHWNDLPWWALNLDAPKTIESSGPPPHPEIAPASMKAVYTYGPRGEMPPVTYTWYQGEIKPKAATDGTLPQAIAKKLLTGMGGMLFIGSKGMIAADYKNHWLLPEDKFKDFTPPPKSIPNVPNEDHQGEWLTACKTGSATGSPFTTYAGPLTEANHLGNVAFRAGKKLEWDPVNMKFPNAPEAEKYLKREYRKGWSLPSLVG